MRIVFIICTTIFQFLTADAQYWLPAQFMDIVQYVPGDWSTVQKVEVSTTVHLRAGVEKSKMAVEFDENGRAILWREWDQKDLFDFEIRWEYDKEGNYREYIKRGKGKLQEHRLKLIGSPAQPDSVFFLYLDLGLAFQRDSTGRKVGNRHFELDGKGKFGHLLSTEKYKFGEGIIPAEFSLKFPENAENKWTISGSKNNTRIVIKGVKPKHNPKPLTIIELNDKGLPLKIRVYLKKGLFFRQKTVKKFQYEWF